MNWRRLSTFQFSPTSVLTLSAARAQAHLARSLGSEGPAIGEALAAGLCSPCRGLSRRPVRTDAGPTREHTEDGMRAQEACLRAAWRGRLPAPSAQGTAST